MVIFVTFSSTSDDANLGLLNRILNASGLNDGQSPQCCYCTNPGAALNEHASIRGLRFVTFHFLILVTHWRVSQEVLETGSSHNF